MISMSPAGKRILAGFVRNPYISAEELQIKKTESKAMGYK